MTRPRFLADHNFRRPIVAGVQRQEPACEILLLFDLDLHEKTDDEVLAYAAEHGLVVLTHDRNTMIAAARTRLEKRLPMPGLLVAREDKALRRRVIESVVLIWACSEAEDWVGVVDFLPW